jgi:hypothetical protein
VQLVAPTGAKRIQENVHQDAKLADFRRSLEVTEGVFAHFMRLITLPGRLKGGSTDFTSQVIGFL